MAVIVMCTHFLNCSEDRGYKVCLENCILQSTVGPFDGMNSQAIHDVAISDSVVNTLSRRNSIPCIHPLHTTPPPPVPPGKVSYVVKLSIIGGNRLSSTNTPDAARRQGAGDGSTRAQMGPDMGRSDGTNQGHWLSFHPFSSSASFLTWI